MAAERVLTIDVGNTNASMGLFVGSRLAGTWDVGTDALRRRNREARAAFREIRNLAPDAVLAISVVPKAVAPLRALCREMLDRRLLLLGRDVPFPVKNLYRRPDQVGQDRLANAVGALAMYRTACIIVDCGTATTIDVVDAGRRYRGGLIFPGIALSLWALSKGTALLPYCEPHRRAKALLGRETSESMELGVIQSVTEACNGLVPRMRVLINGPVTVVLTGGGAALIRPYLTFPHKHSRHLSLLGIFESYKQSQ